MTARAPLVRTLLDRVEDQPRTSSRDGSGQTPRRRVHRVIAELDHRGAIDDHAAMCLRHAIDAAHPDATEMILIDLRDLTAIDTTGLAMFNAHNANCHARGVEMGLLISDDARVTEAFVLAGLGDTLHYTHTPRPGSTQPVRLLDYAVGVRRGRLARAARRCSPRRPRLWTS